MKKIAIAILNWNGKEFINQFLQVVIDNSIGSDVEIVVIDNASTDGSVRFIEENYPQVRTIVLNKNYGFADGYNIGLKQINAEYFILLNSDIEVTPNWIKPVISYMDTHPHVAAAMPKIKSYHSRNFFEYAGASGGFIDKFGYPFCRGRVISHIEEDKGQYDSIIDIFWASGACLFVRASTFIEAGKFDGDFFAHMEEIDLCWRLKRLGYSIVSIPESVVYHVGGGTLPVNTPFKVYLNHRNNLYLLQKNLPGESLFIVLFFRLIMDGLSALMYLSKLNLRFFISVIKAHLYFYKNIKSTQRKRKAFMKLQKVSDVGQIYQHGIVYNYFIRKWRTFDKYKN